MSQHVIISYGIIQSWIVQAMFFLVYSVLLSISVIGKTAWYIVSQPITKGYVFLRFLFRTLTSHQAVSVYQRTGYSLRKTAIAIFFFIVQGIRLIPGVLLYMGRQIVFLIQSFFLGILTSIVAIYRFIFSVYFRSFIAGFIFCIVIFVTYESYRFVLDLPSPKNIGTVNFAQSTHLYDRNGKLLYEIYRDVNRTSIPLTQMPPYIKEATIAIEDRSFYNHKGISFFGGILRAIKDTVTTSELQGGSTITQQLVKSALLTPERTVERKVKEIILALWTEQMYTKDHILEMYLNQVPYGGSAYGIEEAANVYYGKNAKALTLTQVALLAGLPKAPSLFSPFIDPDLALYRRREVLEQMHQLGYITTAQMTAAVKEPLDVKPPTVNIRAPHFVMYTRSELEQEYGSTQIEEAGFRVTTTLDLEIQSVAQKVLQEELVKLAPYKATNGGVIVMRPDTGEILAMVGSADYFKESYGAFNVTTALRQPGSALKPLLYSMALERGFTAATAIDDSPIIFQIPGGEAYQPHNYDSRYHGRLPLRFALANSYNIPAVKVLNTLGVSSFVSYAQTAGIASWEDSSRFGLSLSLGGGEVSLLNLTQIYSMFANGGYRVTPTPVKKIVDRNERIITELTDSRIPVIDPGVAFIIANILSDNNARIQAFGRNSHLEIPNYTVSVKTGTTNDYKDSWTVGFTPKVVVGVWVGNNNNAVMYNVAGSMGAAPIFNRVMTYLLTEKNMSGTPKQPAHVVSKPCYAGKIEYFIRGTENKGNCYGAIIQPGDPVSHQEAKKPQP